MTPTPRTIEPSPLDRNIRWETIKMIDSAKKEVLIIGGFEADKDESPCDTCTAEGCKYRHHITITKCDQKEEKK